MVSSRLLANRALVQSLRPSLYRYASTSAERKAPEVVAKSLLEALPGRDSVTKAGSFTALASVATYLISKEWFVFNGEVWEALALFGAYYIWYSSSKEGASEWFREKRETFRSVLQRARDDHKAVVMERIEHVQQMADVAKTTEDLYAMSKEIAQLEAEQYELKQRSALVKDVKSTLDAWVRYEANQREREQKRVVQSVMDSIKTKVNDPAFQTAYLEQVLQRVDQTVKK